MSTIRGKDRSRKKNKPLTKKERKERRKRRKERRRYR